MDGKYVGKTNLEELKVKSGSHEMKFVKGGVETTYVDALDVWLLTARHEVTAGGDVLLHVDLVFGYGGPDSTSFTTIFHPGNIAKTVGTRTDG